VLARTWAPLSAGKQAALSLRRPSSSALPSGYRTADVVRLAHHRGRVAQIAMASQPSTPPAACAAVSSLEACPTPALRAVLVEALPHARAGVRQPLTGAAGQGRHKEPFATHQSAGKRRATGAGGAADVQDAGRRMSGDRPRCHSGCRQRTTAPRAFDGAPLPSCTGLLSSCYRWRAIHCDSNRASPSCS
jgi:hypothetical protein